MLTRLRQVRDEDLDSLVPGPRSAALEGEAANRARTRLRLIGELIALFGNETRRAMYGQGLIAFY